MSKPQAPQTPPKSPEEIAAARDEQVHVPRGQTRTRFFIILGLMVFSLVIYVVPREFTNVFRRSAPEESSYFTWVSPTSGRHEWSARDFVFERRKFDSVLRVLQQPDMPGFLEDEQLARLIVLDKLALESGVDVSDSDLRRVLTQGGFVVLSRPSLETPPGQPAQYFMQIRAFPDAEIYKQWLARLQTTPIEFQDTLRRLLRVERFEALTALAIQPTPESIERAWKERHQEHQFDFVAFDVESLKAQAQTEVPDEAGLRAWYDALDPRAKRERFPADWKPERNGAELLVWKLDDLTEPATLLEKYPRPSDTDLEELAKAYYTQFKNVRFRRAEPKADAPSEDEKLYQTFDEVAEQVRRESRIHASLVDHAIALQARLKAGETVDFPGEAAAFGLTYVDEQDPKSVADWTSRPEIGDAGLAGSIQRATRGDKFVSLIVTPKAIVFGRATTHVDAGPPAFDEVKDKAAEKWIDDHAQELARTKAQAFRDLLAVQAPTTETQPDAPVLATVDAANFTAKATSLGLTVQTTPWIDEAKLRTEQPGTATELERFQGELSRSLRAAIATAPDEITGPTQSMDKARIYVVRHGGKRDPETVAIEPREYEELHSSAAYENVREVRNRLFGTKALESRFQLAFPARKASTEEGDGEPDAQG